MQLDKLKLVLASKSPRRKELLGWLGIPFEVDSADVDEVSNKEKPRDLVEEIAKIKGEGLLHKYQMRSDWGKAFYPVIVASDTIVTYQGKIFGKPTSRDDAKAMLQFLAGKEHEVITAVYIGSLVGGSWKSDLFSCSSKVRFDAISEDILDLYLDSKEPFDKAGSYGIQGQGLLFISQINGSYSNVVGFPLSHFVTKLKEHLGYENDDKGEWRKRFE